MKTDKIEIGTVTAKFEWMLREHHGWTRLHSDYCSTREEWNKSCDEKIMAAAGESSDSPSLFDRAEFLDCDYYESQFSSIKPETTHIVAKSRGDIEQFSDEPAAQKSYDEAMREHGLERMTCDQGGHAGITERVDVSGISISIYVRGEKYNFEADDDGQTFEAEEVFNLMGGEDLEDAEEIEQMKSDSKIVADLINDSILKL